MSQLKLLGLSLLLIAPFSLLFSLAVETLEHRLLISELQIVNMLHGLLVDSGSEGALRHQVLIGLIYQLFHLLLLLFSPDSEVVVVSPLSLYGTLPLLYFGLNLVSPEDQLLSLFSQFLGPLYLMLVQNKSLEGHEQLSGVLLIA